MIKHMDRGEARKKRHLRVRKKVVGTPERPRLCVFRSLKHIYASLHDDVAGRTLLAASSLDPAIRSKVKHGGNIEAARLVGELVARKCLERGIKQVVFDRAGYLYHGRVAALADAARAAGLEF